MKVRTNVRAGQDFHRNHNQTIARSLKVKTTVRAGINFTRTNHNQTAARGLKVQSGVRSALAGAPESANR